MKIRPRSDWQARPARATSPQNVDTIREAFVHHSAGRNHENTSIARQRQTLRAIQDFHMDDPEHRWSDIAYHYIVFPPVGPFRRATVWEGRTVSAVPAAQLNHNTGTVAICIIHAEPEAPAKNTYWRVGRLIRRFKSVRRVRGHYEVYETECPGAHIRAQLDYIAKVAGKVR